MRGEERQRGGEGKSWGGQGFHGNMVIGGLALIATFLAQFLFEERQTEGQTDGKTDRQMAKRMDRRTDVQ